MENDKSPLTPLVSASTVFKIILPELVSVLRPEAIVIDPPYPEPPVPPIKLLAPPVLSPFPDNNDNAPPVFVFDEPAMTETEPLLLESLYPALIDTSHPVPPLTVDSSK